MNYIFPLTSSNTPHENVGLAKMKAFLRFPEDGAILDELAKYDVPSSFEIKRFEDGSAFICIENSLNGQVGNHHRASFPKISLEEYKNRLQSKIASKNELSSKIDAACDKLKQRVHTHEDTLMILGEIYTAVTGYCDDKPINELRKIMDELKIKLGFSGRSNKVIRQRIVRHIYSLPHHPLKYEDNGKMMLNDIVHRLTDVVSKPEEKQLHNKLNELEKNQTLDEAWFDELADIRKQLMLSFMDAKNPFISNNLKEQILDVLLSCKQSVQAASNNASSKRIIQEYIDSVTIDMLDKYQHQFNGTPPLSKNLAGDDENGI